MGHKFYIGAALLLSLLGVCLWIGCGVESVKTEVSGLVQEAFTQAQQDQFRQAAEIMKQAKVRWEDHHGMLASFSDHNNMDDIGKQLAKGELFAKQQAKELFLACCAELTNMLDAISEEHKFTWWNLLSVAFFPVFPS